MSARTYYVIGDVHGEHDRLLALHEMIETHWKESGGGPATVLHLGDYVDRGPDSRAVVEHLIKIQSMPDLREEIEIVCLLGNHERMMLDAIESGGTGSKLVSWLMNGGEATVESYRRAAPAGAALEAIAPAEHLDWMRSLPTQVIDREAGLVFVHAGVRPEEFPNCSDQVRLWTRSERFMKDFAWPPNPALDGLTVVHGHTPTEGEPYVGPRRINLDTGACYGGPLTAAVFRQGAAPEFLRA